MLLGNAIFCEGINLHFVVNFFDDADGRACIFGVGNGVDAAPAGSDVIGDWL